jgi:hypothetical protein
VGAVIEDLDGDEPAVLEPLGRMADRLWARAGRARLLHQIHPEHETRVRLGAEIRIREDVAMELDAVRGVMRDKLREMEEGLAAALDRARRLEQANEIADALLQAPDGGRGDRSTKKPETSSTVFEELNQLAAGITG